MDFSLWAYALQFLAVITLLCVLLGMMFDPLIFLGLLSYSWERKIRKLQPDISYRGYLLLSYAAEHQDQKLCRLGRGALRFQVLFMSFYALLGVLLMTLSAIKSGFSWDNAGIFLGLFMLIFAGAVAAYAFNLLRKAQKVRYDNQA